MKPGNNFVACATLSIGMLAGCAISSDDSAPESMASGGARFASGGSSMSGSSATTANPTGRGGASGGTSNAQGGATASGGASASGGHEKGGGSGTTGGMTATGGGASSGGSSEVGGATATGGSTASGATKATGGMIATGGTITTGGTSASGGTNCGSIADPAKKGPLTTASYTSDLQDGSKYGSQTMHHPTNGTPPYPAIVIVPGYMSYESSISDWGPYFASHGIVTLTIGTNSTMDQPPARSEALLDALETVKSEKTRAASPLNGKLDLSRLGVMGWSMGGGGTLITVNSHPELKAAITLCAWNPGQTYGSDRVPTLLFAGTADTLAGGQSQGFYTSIPATTPKMLFEVQGADHFYANAPTGADGQCGKYGTAWLKVFLVGDECYRKYLLQQPSGTSDFRTNVK